MARVKPWMVNNALFIVLLIGLSVEMLFMLDEIQSLKLQNSILESKLEQKIEVKQELIESKQNYNIGLSYIIAGAVCMVVVIVTISYFGGVSPDSVGSALNSLGDQTTELFNKSIVNNSDKIMGLHHNHGQIVSQINHFDERISNILSNLSTQIANLDRPKTIQSLFNNAPEVPKFR
jgi:hypothetical protein